MRFGRRVMRADRRAKERALKAAIARGYVRLLPDGSYEITDEGRAYHARMKRGLS